MMSHLFVLLVFVSLFSQASFAEVSGILSLKKGSSLSEAKTQKLLGSSMILEHREMYSQEEQTQLSKLGLKYLAKAWVLKFKNEDQYKSFERHLIKAALPLQLDWNDLQAKSQSPDIFSGYQWGLYNRGTPQTVDLDPVQNYALPARSGRDISLPLAPGQKLQDILVAVLDTGVQLDHPDLKNKIFRNESECQALEKFKVCVEEKDRKTCEKEWMDLKNPLVDQDKNGYPMDCSGWSLLGGNNAAQIMGRPDFTDDQGHGTHVAGIIAADVQNGIGVRGVSSAVKILPVQVIGKQPSEPIKPLSVDQKQKVSQTVDLTPGEKGKETLNKSLGDLIARGVIYSMLSGAKVINFSLGWPQNRDSEYLRSVIQAAIERGIIIVAAAGNDSTKALLRPCAYPGVLCVAAHGPDGALAHFSNYGGGVEIAAPGLNILSTYPEKRRAIRFRSTSGYEFLSGTSQAAPFVAGAAAELLARGLHSSEVIPRLLASAQKLDGHMNLLVGTETTGFVPLAPEKELEQKVVSSGRLNLREAVSMKPVPVIHNAFKEKSVIEWDQKTSRLNWKIQLVNLWAEVESGDIDLSAAFLSHHPEAVRPALRQIRPEVPYAAQWKKGEVRSYILEMEIVDDTPEKTRIPSELEVLVRVNHPQIQRNLRFETDIVVQVTENYQTQFSLDIPIENLPQGRSSLIPIDDNRDANPEFRDYFVKIEKRNEWQLSVLRFNASRKVYETFGPAKIEITADTETVREQILMRADWDFDGESDYILGLYEDRSDLKEPGPSPMIFYIFDSSMRLKHQFTYDSVIAQIPFALHWMKYEGKLVPAWVGPGKDPAKKRKLRDRWENPNNVERPEMRFYYLNNSGKVQVLSGQQDHRIIDVLEPSLQEKRSGLVPVLLAKNLGSTVKPSFVYSFAKSAASDGELEDLEMIFQTNTQSEVNYRNLLDTRVDKVFSLNFGNEETAGTYWFSEGKSRQQRLSLWDRLGDSWMEQELSAERSQFDSALVVRAAFSGKTRKGVFVLTNSEIQYHDLVSKRTARRSLERYTFFADSIFTNLYFPIVVKDSQSLDANLPGLYTTELSGLSRGVKMLVPIFARDGSVIEVVAPARTRLNSGVGCRPLETPVFLGGEMGYALDYFCGNKMIRVPLIY